MPNFTRDTDDPLSGFDEYMSGYGAQQSTSRRTELPPKTDGLPYININRTTYARRRRARNNLVRWVPLWILLGVAIVLAFAYCTLQTPSGRSAMPSVAQPAWQRSVIAFIKKHEPVLSIDRVYKPESLRNAKLRDTQDGMWWDAGGEYAGMAVNSIIAPGSAGYCDSTCKFGVRVEYQIDEGFERVGSRDRVFFLKGDYTVTGYAPTDRVRFVGVVSGDATQKEVAEFFSSGKM